MASRSQPHPTADQVRSALAALVAKHSVPATEAARIDGLEHPGIYTWWVDATGAESLSTGIGAQIEPGLIYGGQAGATKWPSGKRGGATLLSRLHSQHLNGRIRGSTFRLTLAAALGKSLHLETRGSKKLAPGDELSLSEWMLAHLSVAAHPFPNADALAALEDLVLERLDPPLNLLGRPPSPARNSLSKLRSRLSDTGLVAAESQMQPTARLSRRSPLSRQDGRPKLHDEIVAILNESGRDSMSTAEIAGSVNSRGRYQKKDGSPVTAFQIHGRTRKYPHLFDRDGSLVMLT